MLPLCSCHIVSPNPILTYCLFSGVHYTPQSFDAVSFPVCKHLPLVHFFWSIFDRDAIWYVAPMDFSASLLLALLLFPPQVFIPIESKLILLLTVDPSIYRLGP